jgi:hypothetical protein
MVRVHSGLPFQLGLRWPLFTYCKAKRRHATATTLVSSGTETNLNDSEVAANYPFANLCVLFLDTDKGLDASLIVPPLWRSLGVTLWQF